MKARFVPLALIIALLLAFGVIAVACDGSSGEPLTIEEYFQQLEALSDQAAERRDALAKDFAEETAAAGPEGEQLEAFRNFYGATLSPFEDLVDGVKDLNPPTEIEDEHNAFAEAGGDSLNAAEDYRDELEAANSDSELEDLIAELGSGPAFERFRDSCLVLQDVADENGIHLDLNCGIEEL